MDRRSRSPVFRRDRHCGGKGDSASDHGTQRSPRRALRSPEIAILFSIDAKPMSDSPKTASAWAPLGQSLFRGLWIASVVSNIGTWMEEVGEAWLMTPKTPSPLLVALL